MRFSVMIYVHSAAKKGFQPHSGVPYPNYLKN